MRISGEGMARFGEYVELTPCDRQASHDRPPTACLVAEVAAQGFRGRHDGLWFWLDEFNAFVAEFEEFERRRVGTAVLHDISPSDLVLTFSIGGAGGHPMVTAELKRTTYSVGRFELCVRVGFDMDPTALPDALRDFKALPTLAISGSDAAGVSSP